MAFHDVRFPVSLSFGSSGGPERRTEVVSLASGHEERNAVWRHSRRRYDAGLGLRTLDDIDQLIAFFEARLGRLHGFRWRDWADYKSCRPSDKPGFADQVLGQGDGSRTVFQLAKAYASGPQTYVRDIAKPVAGTVLISVAGIEMIETVDYDVDYATGRVTFSRSPDASATVRAGFEFDVPVRFDTDVIQCSVSRFNAGEVPDVPVLEIRT